MGRYEDAEEQLFNCRLLLPDREKAERLIADFYLRMVERFPGEGIWYYKNGLFYYHMAEASPEGFPADFKTIAPDTHKESRIFFPRNNIEDHIKTSFTLPGTLETVYYSQQVFFPRDSGIYYLQKADSLLAEDATIADINDKIGDLYVWQGLEPRSIPHYRKSLDIQPVNAGVRLKFIDALDHNFFYQDALAQMDSLYLHNEINFPKRLLLAKYLVHSGKFDDATKLLITAAQIQPYTVPGIIDLNGRLQLLANHPAEAIAYYKKLFDLNPKDSIVMYTIARLNARMGKQPEAWKWLEAALNNGFNYSFVLKYDNDWNAFRTSPRWQTMIQNRPMKKYPKP
jgi:tetratricopeptide (TPR) repeat protein